jgi:hypothetical protein
VWSLPRLLDLKTKDVRARLGDGADLPGVDATRKMIGERMSPAMRRHVQESRDAFRERSATLGRYKEEMTRLHRDARVKLEDRQQTEWQRETCERAARLPTGLRGLWHRLTGKYREVRQLNEAEAQLSQKRQADERQALVERQLQQREVLQKEFRDLRRQQAEQLLEIRKDIGRYFRFTRGESLAVENRRALGADESLTLKL